MQIAVQRKSLDPLSLVTPRIPPKMTAEKDQWFPLIGAQDLLSSQNSNDKGAASIASIFNESLPLTVWGWWYLE